MTGCLQLLDILEIWNFIDAPGNFYFYVDVCRLGLVSALYAIARPSVCPSVTQVDQSKTVEVRIMQPSPQSSPMTLVF